MTSRSSVLMNSTRLICVSKLCLYLYLSPLSPFTRPLQLATCFNIMMGQGLTWACGGGEVSSANRSSYIHNLRAKMSSIIRQENKVGHVNDTVS